MKKFGFAYFTIIIVCLFISIISGSCDGGSRTDVAHDPDGFLGYSDSFWEWQMKQ